MLQLSISISQPGTTSANEEKRLTSSTKGTSIGNHLDKLNLYFWHTGHTDWNNPSPHTHILDEEKHYINDLPKSTDVFFCPTGFACTDSATLARATELRRLVEVTASAMYNMDDAGGFDNYILRTPPQDGRRAGKHQMSSMFMHICLAQT